jgi:hypothetical protein
MLPDYLSNTKITKPGASVKPRSHWLTPSVPTHTSSRNRFLSIFSVGTVPNFGEGQAYQDFLTLWKDADLDIPVFIAAKAEYTKLQ